jgi:hypothetical protein
LPATINRHQIGVWFCVGFFTGAGWAFAAKEGLARTSRE